MADILLGVVVGAYGVSGQLRIRSFTENPCDIGRYGALRDKAGEPYNLSSVRHHRGDFVVGSMEGVNDRERAQSLRGLQLFVERSALGDNVGDDSYYHVDLIGLSVCGESGDIIGSVSGVCNYGAGDLLEIRLSAEEGDVLLFFGGENIISVELGDRIVISGRALSELSGDVDG